MAVRAKALSLSGETDRDAVTREPADRWALVVNRAKEADGRFVYSVKTTGVYCRPSCPSRAARLENVAFHDSCADAEAAGFRPCVRCRPNEASRDERHAALVTRACRLIDEAETPPRLQVLAKSAGFSPHHFHRIFKATTGLTPRAYADARRTDRVASDLRAGTGSITSAVYDAGFNASSRFYSTSNARLGMTPTAYRGGGIGTIIRFAVCETSLGSLLVATTPKGLCAILIGDDPDALIRDLKDRFPKAELVGGDPGFETTVALVVGFVEAPRIGLDLPLDIGGTAFQQRVWQALRAIPPGTTTTYAEIAKAVGSPKAVRAVGAACGANPLAVAIPCHRVLRSDGSKSGYRWGAERKRILLTRESP